MRRFKAQNIPKPRIQMDFPSHARSVDLEIGAGQGLHAIRYAAAHPDRYLIAIERTHNRFEQLERRASQHEDLKNLILVHADAIGFITHIVPDRSLEKIFLLYPNPYPKAKQANLRWHNSPFMEMLLSKLKVDGTFTVATNLLWYAAEAEFTFIHEWKLQLIEKSTITTANITLNQFKPRTHFEKKYLERGETCWNLHFRKVQ